MHFLPPVFLFVLYFKLGCCFTALRSRVRSHMFFQMRVCFASQGSQVCSRFTFEVSKLEQTHHTQCQKRVHAWSVWKCTFPHASVKDRFVPQCSSIIVFACYNSGSITTARGSRLRAYSDACQTTARSTRLEPIWNRSSSRDGVFNWWHQRCCWKVKGCKELKLPLVVNRNTLSYIRILSSVLVGNDKRWLTFAILDRSKWYISVSVHYQGNFLSFINFS